MSDLTPTSVTNHCEPVEKDRSFGECPAGDGGTLRLNGVTFAKGLGVHANSDISYNLSGTCSRFKASVELDDEVGSNGSVKFQGFADNDVVYSSSTLSGSSATQIVVNAGASASWDHADWALARVECG